MKRQSGCTCATMHTLIPLNVSLLSCFSVISAIGIYVIPCISLYVVNYCSHVYFSTVDQGDYGSLFAYGCLVFSVFDFFCDRIFVINFNRY